jgi:hypothetical protein
VVNIQNRLNAQTYHNCIGKTSKYFEHFDWKTFVVHFQSPKNTSPTSCWALCGFSGDVGVNDLRLHR